MPNQHPSPTPTPPRAQLLAGLRQGAFIGLAVVVLAVPLLVFSGATRGPAPDAAPPPTPFLTQRLSLVLSPGKSLSAEQLQVQSGAVAALAALAMPARGTVTVAPPPPARYAGFGAETPSPDARHLADWVADTRDNAGTGFFIVDKRNAHLYAFDADARLLGASAVLLGGARGDDSVAGIGARPIAQIRPAERTTPAGRFAGQRGRNAQGEDIVWVDYDAAVSMHRVRATNPKERRLERLATPTAADNRISYGCINVPADFYNTHVGPAFAQHRAIVYVLPEVRVVQQVFGSYDVASAHRAPAAPTASTAPATPGLPVVQARL